MHNEIDKKISINIKGSAMDADEGYELRYLLDILSGFEDIIEKTYLFSVGRLRMKEEDRDNLKIVLSNPSKGSFNADLLMLLYDTTLALSPLLIENSGSIWSAVKHTYDYLKKVIDAKKEGKKIVININGNDNLTNVTIGENNSSEIHQFPSYVPDLAESIAPSISKVTKNIDDDKIKSINLLDSEDNKNICLTEIDKRRFESTTFLTDQVYNLEGKITVSNSNSFTGKILVFENDYDIASGEYNFKVESDLEDESYFKEIYLVEGNYECKLRIKLDPSKGLQEVIKELIITKSREAA